MTRIGHLRRFYDLMALLVGRAGGTRRLLDCTGRMDWPQRGVYFFFEGDERRSDTGEGLRVVRVGTHALKTGSRTNLWKRLSQHRGPISSGRGNHRGSIFRLLVGLALIERGGLTCTSWGQAGGFGP